MDNDALVRIWSCTIFIAAARIYIQYILCIWKCHDYDDVIRMHTPHTAQYSTLHLSLLYARTQNNNIVRVWVGACEQFNLMYNVPYYSMNVREYTRICKTLKVNFCIVFSLVYKDAYLFENIWAAHRKASSNMQKGNQIHCFFLSLSLRNFLNSPTSRTEL